MKTYDGNQELIEKLEQNSNLVVLSNRLGLTMYSFLYSTKPLYFGKDNLNIDYLGYIFPKKSPLIPPFNFM